MATGNTRLLVAGGAGFIGSHLVDRLVTAGYGPITVLDNLRRGDIGNLAESWKRIRFLEGDIRDLDFVRRAMRGAGIVYHLAAQSNVLGAQQDEDYSFTTNVAGTLNVLRAARDSGVKRFLFTSSREVYGDPESIPVPESAPLAPKNAYGASKMAGEAYCRAFQGQGMEVRIVRLANAYGPRDYGRVIPEFIAAAIRGEPLTIYGGTQIIDFVWVGTIVESLVRASTAAGFTGVLNVGSGRPTTVMELARAVLAETGSSSEIRVLPPRAIEVCRFVADTTALGRTLGVETCGAPLDRLRDVVDWMRSRSIAAPAATAPRTFSASC
jgi:nucleoside-diphosphate-sugar epimerase